MNVHDLLAQQSFWLINKKLAKELGIDTALLLSELISIREHLITKGEINKQDFSCTYQEIEENTTLSPHQQRKCLDILKNKGFIEIKRKGTPSKNFYTINDPQILNFLTSRNQIFSHQDIKKFNIWKSVNEDGKSFDECPPADHEYKNSKKVFSKKTQKNENHHIYDIDLFNSIDNTISNSIDNNSIYNNNNIYSEKTKKTKIEKKQNVPPTLDEILLYVKEKGYKEEIAHKFFEYYSIADWTDSKGNKVKNWKQKLIAVWFRPEFKIQQQNNLPEFWDKLTISQKLQWKQNNGY